MKRIQPEGPYRIIGYSYGACIGFEIATKLQESDGPNSVEKLILLDGSHLVSFRFLILTLFYSICKPIETSIDMPLESPETRW